MVRQFKNMFHWKPDSIEFEAPLRVRDKGFESQLDLLAKGIDNAHVDVQLSEEFISRVRLLVRKTLLHEVAQNHWGEPPPPPDAKDVQLVREGYVGMMEVAVDKARQKLSHELIHLVQFAVMKLLLEVTRDEIERLRAQLKRACGMDVNQSNNQSMELHQRLVVLMKEEPELRYRINRRLFREIYKMETTRLAKLRKSVLGRSWPVPKAVLFNPMLELPSLWADAQFMRHYTLVCTDPETKDGFNRVNRIVTSIFEDFLPTWAWPLGRGESYEGMQRRDLSPSARRETGDSLGFAELDRLLGRSLQAEEFDQGLVSWLDAPENMDRIIYSAKSRRIFTSDQQPQHLGRYWNNPKWPLFHARLLKKILRGVRSSGLEKHILACHAAPRVAAELNADLPIRLVCQYLSGKVHRREMLRRLTPSMEFPERALKLLDRARSGLKTLPVQQRNRRIFSFLRHFLQLRRDLKYAYTAYKAMSRIRLLSRPEDIELSRGNGTLHDFVLREERQPSKHQIRNHVIIKADLRGSTAMTSQLRQKNLNPASHFSLNFFEPINKLLPVFGAKKVFVEGDAVILSIFEYEDTPYQWLCVSHACGLAAKILQVVDTQNALNRKYGLPPLELGLGITFSDEAPTFLYDEEREIMISSAINRADQLSSCSASLRKSGYGKKLGRGVEVLEPGHQTLQDKESSDQLIRYNVNGIELDLPAFYKLKSELALKQVELPKRPPGERFFGGRYPDQDGKMHWIVIREAAIKVWNGDEAEAVSTEGRRYYEVVTDADLQRSVVDTLNQRRPIGPHQQSGVQQDVNATGPRYLH
jgi:hypothetical protein